MGDSEVGLVVRYHTTPSRGTFFLTNIHQQYFGAVDFIPRREVVPTIFLPSHWRKEHPEMGVLSFRGFMSIVGGPVHGRF